MSNKTTQKRASRQAAAYYRPEIVGEVFTRKQAASYLKLCCNKIDALPIAKIRVGRSVRIRKCDIDEWLAQEVAKAAVK